MNANDEELRMWLAGDHNGAITALRERSGARITDCHKTFELAEMGESWESLNSFALLKRIRALELALSDTARSVDRMRIYTDVIGGPRMP